jgi:serine/threonine protein kinase/tetratricopeptide (TPR) repeat protein
MFSPAVPAGEVRHNADESDPPAAAVRFLMNGQPAPENSLRVLGATHIADMPPENVGSVIGPYKLLQPIGQGGFGVVYMAEQEKPVRRVVALKIIKPGMDTGQVIARFESERQALALMDHPNIAKVLDAGATASGHPYFVMELVKGVPITEFCDKNHLAPEARLNLFGDVCHAIQHAHHKGIIHRDIKPSNVMVTLHDGVPFVKVIDFGVAKATVQKLTEKTLFTAYGQMIGTPEYMSPEQAEMSGLDIDTRSDVYSLGVLLYELLTGTTPLEAGRLREAGFAKMLRLIQDEETPRPSTRLSSLGDSATVVAGNRGLDVKRLVQLLAGDLDWVVMKALEKDRNRRYATPGNFAEDIDRYLRHEAILARPPSTGYRLRKLVRRNRGAVLTAAGVVGALVAGTAFSTWQAVRATRAERNALAAAEAEGKAKRDALVAADGERKAKETALLAAKAEKHAKDDAVARETETKAVLDFVEEKVIAAARPKGELGGLGPDVTLRRALEAAMPFVDKGFREQPLIEARLHLTLGRSFRLLGYPKIALNQVEKARALFAKHRGPDDPDTLQCMNELGGCLFGLGRFAEALKLREETLALRKARFGPDHRDTLISMINLASSYSDVGRHAEAFKLAGEVLSVRKAKLGPDHPDTLSSMRSLAVRYTDLGRHAEAAKLLLETLARQQAKLGPDHPETLRSMHALAASYTYLGRHLEAAKLYAETLALERSTLGPDHPETLITMNNLAVSYVALGRHAEALKLHEETLAIQKVKLGPSHPDTLMTMYNIACDHAVMIPNSVNRGKEAERAMECLQQAVAAGFNNLGQMKRDSDLDALRDRADFKQLLAKLEAGKPKEKKR